LYNEHRLKRLNQYPKVNIDSSL